MIYILIIAALLIINFTNVISKLENKENRSNFDKVVLILGKGHEKFQIVKSKKIAYSDKSEVIKLMV